MSSPVWRVSRPSIHWTYVVSELLVGERLATRHEHPHEIATGRGEHTDEVLRHPGHRAEQQLYYWKAAAAALEHASIASNSCRRNLLLTESTECKFSNRKQDTEQQPDGAGQ